MSKVLKRDAKNGKLTTYEVAHVGAQRKFTSDWQKNEDGSPKVVIGHYYTLSVRKADGTYLIGDRFISNAQLAEVMTGKKFRIPTGELDSEGNMKYDLDEAIPQTLIGAKINFYGLVEVPKGAEFEAFDGQVRTATSDSILYNKMTVDAGLTKIDVQTAQLNAMLKAKYGNMDATALDNALAEFGL